MMIAFFNAASTLTLALQLQSRMGSRQFTETLSSSPMTGESLKLHEYFQMKLFFRNLRLKAHTADCAVNSIKEFVKWVKTIKK